MAIAAARIRFSAFSTRGQNLINAAVTSAPASAQCAFSKACARQFAVSTADQQNNSATMTIGTRSLDISEANLLPVSAPASRNSSAHCAAKHSSATVAIVRVTATREIHTSYRQMRGTSIIGSSDRKAQPNTYAAESHSISRRFASSPGNFAPDHSQMPGRQRASVHVEDRNQGKCKPPDQQFARHGHLLHKPGMLQIDTTPAAAEGKTLQQSTKTPRDRGLSSVQSSVTAQQQSLQIVVDRWFSQPDPEQCTVQVVAGNGLAYSSPVHHDL